MLTRAPYLLVVLFACTAEAAGPETSARLLAQANAISHRPTAERIVAYRAVLRARKRFDVNAFRALRKLASLYGKGGDPHAQAALAAWSSVRHPKNERGTFLARVRLARGLRSEGDLAAAETVFRDVIAHGGRIAIWAVAKSLGYLGEDAFDRGDAAAVRWAVKTGERAHIDPVTQMRLLGMQGLLALRSGARDDAERLRRRCARIYEKTQRGEAELARKAARAWLDLPLRRELAKE